MVDLEKLRLLYFQNDEPVEYETKSGYKLKIHPILVKDWSIFESSLNLLMIKKNEISDINIIKMSYLQFINEVLMSSDDIYKHMFYNIITMSLKEDIFFIGKDKGKSVIVLGDEQERVKGIIKSKEFDDISKIIMFQNIIDYDDRDISKEVREAMEEYQSLKNQNISIPTLEKKKAYIIGKTGITMKSLNEMTYRTFSQVYNSELESELYLTKKMIQASPKYDTGKENIIHPLFDKKKDPYAEMFLDNDSFKQKIGQGAKV